MCILCDLFRDSIILFDKLQLHDLESKTVKTFAYLDGVLSGLDSPGFNRIKQIPRRRP